MHKSFKEAALESKHRANTEACPNAKKEAWVEVIGQANAKARAEPFGIR